nr:ORF4 [Acipenserid herpesvirus 1]
MDLQLSVTAQMYQDYHSHKMPLQYTTLLKPKLAAGYKHGALLVQECYVVLESMFQQAPYCDPLYILWLRRLKKFKLGAEDGGCKIKHLKVIQGSLQDLCLCWPHAKVDRRVFKTPVPDQGYTSHSAVNLAYLLLDVAWDYVAQEIPSDLSSCGPTEMMESDQLFVTAKAWLKEIRRRHSSYVLSQEEEYLTFLKTKPDFDIKPPTQFYVSKLNAAMDNIQNMALACLGSELLKKELEAAQCKTNKSGAFVTNDEIVKLTKTINKLRMFCHRMASANFTAKQGLNHLSRSKCDDYKCNKNYTGKAVWINKLILSKMCQMMMS